MTTAQFVNITNLVVQLKTALSQHILALIAKEIGSVLKMGDKTIDFADKVKDYMVSNPEFVPTEMINVDNFNIDYNTFKTFMSILKSITP